MKNKYHVKFLFLGIFTVLLNIVLIYFFKDTTHPFVFLILNFLSCLFLLPNAIHNIQAGQDPTPTDWRIFFGLIIWTIGSIIGLIICVVYLIKFL